MKSSEHKADDLYKVIGKRIRAARERRGLSQKRLADEVELTRTSITNIEKGRQKLLIHTVYLLAEALATPVGELIAPPSSDPFDETTSLVRAHVSEDIQYWVLSGIQAVAESRK